MTSKYYYFFIGTTAEFIKLAPIIKELIDKKIPYKIITSGQNQIRFDDLKDFLGTVNIDIPFKLKATKSSLFHFLNWAIKTLINGILLLNNEFRNKNKNNTYFVVHGDTASSLIGSLIAKFYRLKLVHIESGLRSYNFLEPFPEEICRFIIIHLADVLFCPNDWALNNIRSLSGIKLSTKYNTLIETCQWALKTKKIIDLSKKGYYILYIRRQEHIFFKRAWIENVIKLVITNTDPSLNCIFITNSLNAPLIPIIEEVFSNYSNAKLIKIPGMQYTEFMHVIKNAEFMATDGCTNQEDTYFIGTPMLALRRLSERIEGLNTNVVISCGEEHIIKDFMDNYKQYRQKPVTTTIEPSKIIVDYLQVP